MVKNLKKSIIEVVHKKAVFRTRPVPTYLTLIHNGKIIIRIFQAISLILWEMSILHHSPFISYVHYIQP